MQGPSSLHKEAMKAKRKEPDEEETAAADDEFHALVRQGLADPDDLLTKGQRRAKLRKQQLKKGGGDAGSYWSQLGGWKPVDAELLLGAEEGGFAGLEVLEDPTVIDPAMLPAGA